MTDQRLSIEITAQDKTKSAFNSAQKNIDRLNRSGKTLNTNMGGLQNTLLKVGAALGGFAVVRGIVGTIRTFEDLRATLVTVEGSTEQAAKSFEMLRKFTAQTTFQLDEVSTAFITLRNAGLQPTEKMMFDIGNIAAGMGKRLDDVARAVFNATTGEFEMLKQLGIKVRTEGDQLRVSFRGITQQIDNDSQSIVQFLRRVGSEDFAGAIQSRSATLTGAISNMRDAIAEVAVAIGEGGFATALTNAARDMKDFAENSKETAKQIGQALGTAVKTTMALMKTLAENIELVAAAFATIISYKMAILFASVATQITAMTKAMDLFNLAVKRNIIFGSIAVFSGAMVFLISKFKEFKGELEGVEFTGNLATDIKIATEEIDLLTQKISEIEAAQPEFKTLKQDVAKMIEEGMATGDPKSLAYSPLFDIQGSKEYQEYLKLVQQLQDIRATLKLFNLAQNEEEVKADQEKNQQLLLQTQERLRKQAELSKKAFEKLEVSLFNEREAIDHTEKEKLEVVRKYRDDQLKLIEDMPDHLRAKQDRILEIETETTEAELRIAKEASDARLELDRKEADEKERIAKEAEAEAQRLAQEAIDQQMRAAQQIADITGDQTRLIKEQYKQRHRDLEQSLEDQSITQEEYNKMSRKLNQQQISAIAEADRASAQEKMQALIELAELEGDLINEATLRVEDQYDRRKQVVENALRDELITYERYARLVKKVEDDKAKAIEEAIRKARVAEIQAQLENAGVKKDIAQQEAEDRALFEEDKVEFAKKKGLETLQNMAQINKKAFEAYKAFQLAQAIIDTAKAVTRALSSYPPPFNFIAAAASASAGAVQIAAIRSQQYQGREKGGPVRKDQTYLVGESGVELFTPDQDGEIIPNNKLRSILPAPQPAATMPEPFRDDQNSEIIPNNILSLPARQFGGPVRAGQSYIVGESGVEVFSPDVSRPNPPQDQLAQKPVIINFRVEAIDAQSFNGALAEQRDTIVGIVNEAVNDGGRRSLTA